MCQQACDRPGWEKMVALMHVQHLPLSVAAPCMKALLGDGLS